MKILSNIYHKKSNPQCLEIAIFGIDSSIGDEVMLLKPLLVLKALYPKCKITLLVQSSYATCLFSHIGFIDEIIPIY